MPTYWAGKEIFEGVTDTEGGGAVAPLKVIVSGLSAALSVIPTAALRIPSAVGVKIS